VELPLGALCAHCHKAIERRARRVARLVGGLSTAAMALYVFIPPPPDERARVVGLAGIVIWYILTNAVVRRVMRNWQR
jgi:hypothetical protein